MGLKMAERTGVECVVCPYCGLNTSTLDSRGKKVTPPRECGRCGSPMDEEAVSAFADKMAKKEHIPALAAIGARARAMGGPPVDAMMSGSVKK